MQPNPVTGKIGHDNFNGEAKSGFESLRSTVDL